MQLNFLSENPGFPVQNDLPGITREIWGQFHQRSMYSFYTRRSQKRKNTDDLTVFFMLWGSTSAKGVRRTLMKSTPVYL
jgi:hypothetical protein